ncbi:NEL-type E3 ubiquitin ligase domain-containing protein [Pseudomonas sp. NPDC089996]|uniref:NEL-type E3 ubiquitin ligase domain-containing protein n=1 Tax=Pseudomonas sp. NPDC089996 TaxID=3364474 RepID=UPI00381F8CE0
MATSAFPDDSIDALIASRVPAWLGACQPHERQALLQSLRLQQNRQAQVSALFGSIPALDDFAGVRLDRALQEQHSLLVDCRLAKVRMVTSVQLYPFMPGVPGGTAIKTFEHPLLVAALHNFTETEATRASPLPGNILLDPQGLPMAMDLRQFATLCRNLDLGGQYQAELKAILEPAGEAGVTIRKELAEYHQASLLVAVHLAGLQGQLDRRCYEQFLAIGGAGLDSPALQPHSLRLLGRQVQGVVAFEISHSSSTGDVVEGVLCWVPGDPDGPLRWHASWAQLFEALGRRLRGNEYAAFFDRFIRQADRAAFQQRLSALQQATEGSEPLLLDGRTQLVPGSLFEFLAQAQLDNCIEDARVLAVPTAQVDSAERTRRLMFYLSVGVDLLGMASFYVSALAWPMAAIGALQLVDDIYEGYADWRVGDREAALQHLFSVAGNLALTGVPVGVGHGIERFAAVDDLLPVRTKTGQLKLCSAQLPGYQIESSETGIGQRTRHPEGERLGTHAGTFLIEQPPGGGGLRIRHPQRPQGYAPRMSHNGAGMWRHELELPQEWPDSATLFRRLGIPLQDAPQSMVNDLLTITGLDADRLRRLHLEDMPPPARLLDAWQRHELHERYPRLRGAAFESVFADSQAALPPEASVLLRDFPGLTRRAAKELTERADGVALGVLREGRRVPLSVAEDARWSLRESRIDRACAGLLQPQAGNADTSLLALGMLVDWAPWPEHTRVELREGDAQGALLASYGAGGGTHTRTLVSTNTGFQGYNDGTPVATANNGLLHTLYGLLDEQQRRVLGDAGLSVSQLAKGLAARAATHREHAGACIGLADTGQWVRPPARLGDGRLGYPLSGRGAGAQRGLIGGYRQLFPTITPSQLHNQLEELRAMGVDPWEHYNNLQGQWGELADTLDTWRHGVGGLFRGERRQRVCERIRASWRRQLRDPNGSHQLILENERIGELPTLPAQADFSHVSRLSLRGMDLAEVNPGFLRGFTNVRHLDLRDNRLLGIPEALEHLPRLTELLLGNNRIVIGSAGVRRLASLADLRVLDLAQNPLGSAPALQTLLPLRQVSLRGTALAEVPMALLEHPLLEHLDLRGNRIGELSEEAARLIAMRPERVVLHDNPLSEAARLRLRRWLPNLAERVLPRRQHAQQQQRQPGRWLEGLSVFEREQRLAQWNNLAEEPGADGLIRFLRDLAASAEYDRQPGELRRRVWRIVEACERHGEIRQALLQQANAERGCADQLLLLLSTLEVRLLSVQRTAGLSLAEAEAPLVRLGRELFRLDQVDRIALAHIDTVRRRDPHALVDDVEVLLAYRVGLARQLHLPGQPSHMYHARFSGVEIFHLGQAARQVEAAQTPAAVSASLAQRDIWVDYLHERYPGQFEASDAPFHERLEGLLEQAATLPDQTYRDQVDAVAQARTAAEQALIRRLTDQAIRRNP